MDTEGKRLYRDATSEQKGIRKEEEIMRLVMVTSTILPQKRPVL